MKELETLKVEYVGYAAPANKDEIELELLGLDLAIKSIEQRMALLRQGLKLSEMRREEPDE